MPFSFFSLYEKVNVTFRGVHQSPWRGGGMHKLKVIWKFGNFYLVKNRPAAGFDFKIDGCRQDFVFQLPTHIPTGYPKPFQRFCELPFS
jgi:hypothetical protein